MASKEHPMTPKELETIRLMARIGAVEAMLAALIRTQARSKTGRQSTAAELDHWAASCGRVAFPGLSPEYSDLYAAELQAAVESLVSFVKSNLLRD
jgi:hypothetical protein